MKITEKTNLGFGMLVILNRGIVLMTKRMRVRYNNTIRIKVGVLILNGHLCNVEIRKQNA